MKNTKRILALFGVILLALLYVGTIFVAIFSSENVMGMVTASVVATILIPITIFLFIKMEEIRKKKD